MAMLEFVVELHLAIKKRSCLVAELELKAHSVELLLVVTELVLVLLV
jgi:hypothetical protein